MMQRRRGAGQEGSRVSGQAEEANSGGTGHGDRGGGE